MEFIFTVVHLIVALVALKAMIWGCGGPTLRGWNDVVPRDRVGGKK